MNYKTSYLVFYHIILIIQHINMLMKNITVNQFLN